MDKILGDSKGNAVITDEEADGTYDVADGKDDIAHDTGNVAVGKVYVVDSMDDTGKDTDSVADGMDDAA